MSIIISPQSGDGAIADRCETYGSISRFNHWVMAALFIAALGLGLVMEYGGLERETVGGLMDWHKAFGVSVLAFGVWRVGWRIARGFPAPVAGSPDWQVSVAKAVHWMLLAAIIMMPLSGVVMSMAGGRALEVFGVTLLPSLGTVDWLGAVAHAVHGYVGPFIAGVVALHIAAALKHQLIDRDGTIARMVSGTARHIA